MHVGDVGVSPTPPKHLSRLPPSPQRARLAKLLTVVLDSPLRTFHTLSRGVANLFGNSSGLLVPRGSAPFRSVPRNGPLPALKMAVLGGFPERGRLAQLVERLVYTENVGGSSPSSPTIFRHSSSRTTPAKAGVQLPCGRWSADASDDFIRAEARRTRRCLVRGSSVPLHRVLMEPCSGQSDALSAFSAPPREHNVFMPSLAMEWRLDPGAGRGGRVWVQASFQYVA